jgi:hypothetical protein
MVGANYMELIGLTTAMADAQGTMQATLREMRNRRGEVLSNQGYYTDPDDIEATIEATENALAVVQVHLSYVMSQDNLLSVPGTNSDNWGISFANLFTNLIRTERR